MTAPTLPEPRPDDEGRVFANENVRRAFSNFAYRITLDSAGCGLDRAQWVAREIFDLLADPLMVIGTDRGADALRIVRALTPHPAPLGATDEGLRLVPVDQTRFGAPEGNCLMACVASLTGLPLDVLDAAFPPGEQEGEHWWTLFSTVLHSQGWHPVYIPGADGVVPRGYAIGSGVSPRDLRHAIVVKDGQLTHDPHPSREGATVDGYYVLLPARAALQAGAAS